MTLETGKSYNLGMFVVEMTVTGGLVVTSREGMKIEPLTDASVIITPAKKYDGNKKNRLINNNFKQI